MSRAYLIIIIPAAIVAVFYVAMFRGLGFDLSAWPFLGTAVLFGGALIAVLRYQRRKQKRRDS